MEEKFLQVKKSVSASEHIGIAIWDEKTVNWESLELILGTVKLHPVAIGKIILEKADTTLDGVYVILDSGNSINSWASGKLKDNSLLLMEALKLLGY